MYWHDENDNPETYQVPEDVVDIAFRLDCRTLLLDHAQALSTALHTALPWIVDEPELAIHTIHVAESGNGWMRPENGLDEVLHLSRRTRMRLRLPQERVEEAQQLTGQTLDIGGSKLKVGDSAIHKLSKQTTLFSRYVLGDNIEDEAVFMQEAHKLLLSLGIQPKKMMPGLPHSISTADGDLHSRTLMLAELSIDDSVRLQQLGLGAGRKLGCGIFIPHKGIDSVAGSATN